MAPFIPLKKLATAKILAKDFVREIWCLHGLPTDIVLDRDSCFTSDFWKSTLTLLGICPRMLPPFRPQIDGQTEKVTQSIELYVRTFCTYEQDDLCDLRSHPECAYNNSVTSGTGLSPFYANYGFHPRTNWPTEVVVGNPASETYVHYVSSVHGLCKEGLKKRLMTAWRNTTIILSRSHLPTRSTIELCFTDGISVPDDHRESLIIRCVVCSKSSS